eukprot:scaffold48140_cov68-Cyclotella_meneghiniana.AAC.8
MSKQGSDVIEANDRSVSIAKRALASSERHLQAAKDALTAAQKIVEVAQRECDQAKIDLNHAEQAQTAALKKYEVVNLMKDDAGDKKPRSGNSKKRAAAFSDDLHTKKLKCNTDLPLKIVVKGNVLSEANGARAKRVQCRSNSSTGVLIEGCGVAQANGLYNRDGSHNEIPKYSRIGRWKGKDVRFVVYSSFGCWYISIWSNGICFYKAKNESSEPPTDGWRVSNFGVEPLPKVTF